MAQTVTLRITGMTCDQCARTLEQSLNDLPGVQARVSFRDTRAEVALRDPLPMERLLQAIRAQGYGAEPQDSETGPTARHGGATELKVVILGSGAAAFACAIRAASESAQVTMIERGIIGGTCVNTGCLPSKIMIRMAQVAQAQEHHPFPGIDKVHPLLDRRQLVAQQQTRVAALRQAKYQNILDGDPRLHRLQGQVRFTAAHTLVVKREDGREQNVVADRILIALGASPAIPSIPGLADSPYWTSTEALVAAELPEHLIILGGSMVGLELGQAFLRLGCQVTLIARSRLLSREETIIGTQLQVILEREGMRILTDTHAKEVYHRHHRFEVDIHTETITGDRLLVAAGRRANTADLGLDTAGVKTDHNGAIVVDDHLRTSVEHIYAAGDCTTQPPFVYVAAAAGTCAAVNMLGGVAALDLSTMPTVMFTDPQAATVGFTEGVARKQKLAVDSRTLALEHVPRALANFQTDGFIKLVAERASGRLLGTQILAPQAGEMITLAALAIRQRLTVKELADMMFPYLVMAEGLKLCAQTFSVDVTKLSCCAG